MKTYDSSLASQFAHLLAQREAELRNTLQADYADAMHTGDGQFQEVADFKDSADGMAAATVEDAQSDLAAHALQQVLAAQRRLQHGEFGHCLDCGEAIDLRRLQAMPAAALCASCQRSREAQH